MTYDNWKTTEEPNEAADEAEATKQAQEEAEAEEEWCHALAMKIQAMPRERRLSLERMVESPHMSAAELFNRVKRDLPEDSSFSVKVELWQHRLNGGKPSDPQWQIYVEKLSPCFYDGGSPEEALRAFHDRHREPLSPTSPEDVDVGF